MSKYKRVWAILGVVGMLCALMALSTAAPTPAGAQTPPPNQITLTKIVNGTYDGPAGANFTLTVNCPDPDGAGPLAAFAGSVIYGTDGVAQSPTTINVPATYGLTDALRCVITETGAGANSADAVVMQATTSTPAQTDLVQNNIPPIPTTSVRFSSGGNQRVSAFIVNSYNAVTNGRVQITKDVEGVVPAGAIFQINVTCGANVATAVFVGEGTQTVSVPTTAGCTPVVSEPVAQPAPASVTYDPPALLAFPAGSNDLRTVRVINTYAGPTNAITVTKSVVGTAPAGTQYTVVTTCWGSFLELLGNVNPVASSHVFNAGESYVFQMPANKPVCSTVETQNGGASQTSVTVFPVLNGAVITSGGVNATIQFQNTNGGHTAAIGFTNRFIAGPVDTITVDKRTVGTVPAGTPFLVRINCGYDIDPSTAGVQNDYYMAFGAGLPSTQSASFPANAGGVCTVRETVSGGATSVTYASGPASTGVTLGVAQNPNGNVAITWPNPNTGSTAQVNITNTFPQNPKGYNTLRIKKQLRGRIPAGASFSIRVRCSGGGITDEQNLTFTTNSFQEILVSASRTDCRVTETANGGAQSVSYFASSATADATDGPNSARIDFGNTIGGQRGKVIVRNQFPGTCPRPGPKFC